MTRITFIILTLLISVSQFIFAQNERKFVREGNRYYEKALADTTKLDTTMYSQAETAYRKALDKRPDDLKWDFNLGDALYKQMKFEESAAKFGQIADKSTDKVEKSRALHNMGNSLLMQNKLDESIEAYKDALRKNPDDLETKYNLLYAMNMKKKQQEQQKNKDKENKDQNKDQNQNKDDQNKDKQDQNKDQNKDKQNQQQQPQQSKISKENAERLLQALQNNEKDIQEKVKKVQAEKAQSRKTEKDW
ncbi:MAG: hypothetical protein A2W90_03075 [Bacteroidetes bacterium GWF2_42_66]|nr:MAG: hypothetical protein A2W92_10470 [Bacteroidetes bacterium GWA2_42_15]OFY01416.1 MAG: hypothetical protein A2W89_16560 [Bacteroidetes bacterium GWE2_42_39]OFY42257.1 MAG: hypothetical protein A2W90_03075 [Bacteroidetes bacterium GWF2_42_66]HBL77624.1 hypothetical protein [Prolixibacteraceae bacterium]HCB62754.1 hypothetical protein [Bacteroidales bacterium]